MLSKLISANTCWKDEKYLYFRISSIKKKKRKENPASKSNRECKATSFYNEEIGNT